MPSDAPRPWSPIVDLSIELHERRDPELDTLIQTWRERRKELADSTVLADFVRRLVRRWSIETGILERLYTLNEGVTQTFVEQGFDAAYLSHGDSDLPADRLIEILEDHRAAAEGLFVFVRQGRELSESFVKELHQQLLSHQSHCDAVHSLGQSVHAPVLKGAYKVQPNNPGDRKSGREVHFYCPPEQVASEMERLIELHRQHVHGGVPYEVEAAWLHHRFTQIHPFQDGNGRVARALATLVCLRAGGVPLVVTRDDKPAYIAAVRAADAGELEGLIGLFRSIQKRSLREAMSLADDSVQDAASRESILGQVKRLLQDAERARSKRLSDRIDLVRKLADDELSTQRGTILEQIGKDVAGLHVDVFADVDATRHWFRGQISRCASELGYFADLSRVSHWAQLRIHAEVIGQRTGIVIAIHGLGRGRTDLVAVHAFVTQRLSGGDAEGEAAPWSVEPACEEPFNFDATWELEVLTKEFRRWLRPTIDQALRLWLASM